MTPEQLAALAGSLKDNEAFQQALDDNRSNALEGLAQADATDAETIRNHQAMVRLIDTIRADLDRFVRAGKPARKPGIA